MEVLCGFRKVRELWSWRAGDGCLRVRAWRGVREGVGLGDGYGFCFWIVRWVRVWKCGGVSAC
jgi:hypothetical protein